ncbi:C-x8-C-x5-C-x3-H type zinc finger protein [Rutstroemia sp. NJR-2017a WRK4]|nr:C-x8-C-x5-C-x3-H type zinc finger protein [Rutstroemia sp. NJR-2017a WRK4]
MDAHAHNHAFIQDDVDLNGLLGNSGTWPDQYAYQQPHVQDPYGRYTTSQPSYDQQTYDLSHQTSYTPVSYSTNSPYTSQYQNTRASDVFSPAPYDLDPSLQEPTSYHGVPNSFPFQPSTTHSTISPQTLQYNMLSQQQLNNGIQSSPFQPSTGGPGTPAEYSFGQRPQANQTHYYNQPQNGTLQQQQKAIHEAANKNIRYANSNPELAAKQNAKPYVPEDNPSSSSNTTTISAPSPVPIPARIPEVKPIPPQNPLRITHPELLAKTTSSRPRFSFAPFVVWDDTPIQVAPGLKNTIPKYHPRKSRSGQELVPGLPKARLSATPARVSKKIRVPKEKTKHVSSYKGTGRSAFDKVSALRADGSSTPVKSPSTPTETSSSEEDSTSEEESDYEDEDDEIPSPIDISTVREATRPSDVPNAARWDAIGIVWKDPNSSPSAEAIASSIDEYANVVIALRTQIKDLAAKIDEATKSKAGDAQIQKLKNNRIEKLEVLYETIEAANKHGYGPIVENLGNHQKLVNALTTSLIDCAKSEDYLGKLPKAVFALLAKFHTLTDELLKKLKFEALQKRWNKRGDQETKNNIATILGNTTDAKERAGKSDKTQNGAGEAKKNLEKIEQSKPGTAENVKPAAGNPSKRPHDGDGSNGKPTKKFAADVSGAPASSMKIPKRSTNVLANNLLGISSKPTPKPTPKPAPPKKKEPSPPPTESKLGALLASIAQPPEPPKKSLPAPGPPETPEEKKRRERKESRRHLRVKFKEGDDLEEVRLFKHEQAEDEGRQDNMLRDAHDDRSEGMMHKQRVLESMDEDEETLSTTINDRPYPDLIEVDFSSLEKTTPFGPTYVTRGGDLKFTTPEQQTQDRREALELLVVYSDPSDIPQSAKEPSAANDGSHTMTKQLKLPPSPWLLQRLQEIQQLGPEYARHLFMSRLEQRKVPDSRDNQNRNSQFASPSADVSTLLQQISGAPQHQKAPAVPAMNPAVWENLTRIVHALKGKPYPATEPPEWMSELQKKDWWGGFSKDKAIKDRKLAEERQVAHPQIQTPQHQSAPAMVAPMAVQQTQTQTYQPQMTQPAMTYNPASASASAVPDASQQAAEYLKAWQDADAKYQLQQQQPTFDFSAWSNVPGLQQYAQATQPRWDGAGNGKDHHVENNGGGGGSAGGGNGRKSRVWKDGGGPLDANGEYRGKKKPCKFFKEGKCAKGAACTYLHD